MADVGTGFVEDLPLAGPIALRPATGGDAAEGARSALQIDADGAFGSGSHPTTRLLLEALASRARPGLRVLDFGTGSGILTLLAAALGARAVGIDRDPAAIACAERNRLANRIPRRSRSGGGARFLLGESPAIAGRRRWPLIVANLFGPSLIELADPLARALSPGGELLLSGALLVDAGRVERAFVDRGLVPAARSALTGWALLALVNQPPASG